MFAMPGATVCRLHGGLAPQVQRKAAERVIEEHARQVAKAYAVEHIDISDPIGALMQLAAEVVGFKNFIAERVTELRTEEWRYGTLGGEQLRAEVAVYERAMDRAGRLLVDINRLGLEERQVRIAEQQGELLATVVMAALDEIGLTGEQLTRAYEVIPRRLRAIDGGA
jgi:hypothetical protein